MSTTNHPHNRSHQAIERILTILSVLMMLMMILVTSAFAKPVKSGEIEVVNASSIWLEGPIKAIPGGTVSYNITSDVIDLYGAQLELSFDPAVLQVLDDNPKDPGIQITPGSCPVPLFVVINSADNGAGTVSYAVTSLSPTPPCDGGVVASIQFQVSPTATVGTTQVQFDVVLLSDINGIEIPVTAVDLDLEIVESNQIFLPVVVKD